MAGADPMTMFGPAIIPVSMLCLSGTRLSCAEPMARMVVTPPTRNIFI